MNRIYWTTGDPAKPRGFDCGIEAVPRGGRQGDLLMIEGPLGIRWRERRIEAGELAHYDPPTPYRVQRWLDRCALGGRSHCGNLGGVGRT